MEFIPEWLTGAVAAIILSAAVRALPEPENGNKFYLWFYRFTHRLLANFDKANLKPKE
jgi:hypothetical protein